MKKYQIIYADPPWHSRHCISNSRRIENQYNTMTLEEIKKLNIPSADNSVLYLWTPAPKLEEALEVIKAWDFDYRTNMTWDKEVLGMGYWFRNEHEHLLVGVKGKFSPPPAKLRVYSMLHQKRRKHSQKPDIVREWINLWYPNKTKIELFARKPDNVLFEDDSWKSWDCIGNDINGKDIRQELEKLLC